MPVKFILIIYKHIIVAIDHSYFFFSNYGIAISKSGGILELRFYDDLPIFILYPNSESVLKGFRS